MIYDRQSRLAVYRYVHVAMLRCKVPSVLLADVSVSCTRYYS